MTPNLGGSPLLPSVIDNTHSFGNNISWREFLQSWQDYFWKFLNDIKVVENSFYFQKRLKIYEIHENFVLWIIKRVSMVSLDHSDLHTSCVCVCACMCVFVCVCMLMFSLRATSYKLLLYVITICLTHGTMSESSLNC